MSRCIPAGSQLLATVGNLKFDGHRQRLAGFRDRIREAGFPMEGHPAHLPRSERKRPSTAATGQH